MKQQQLILVDLFSGAGGFTKGLLDANLPITTHYFSEIEKHAVANYKYNFKNSKYVGSILNVNGRELRAKHPNAKFIITFGSPCQDFSLAGNRKGMDGQRSSLIMEAIRLISEIQPDFFIWENVKGTFSSNNSKDFWAILNAFTNIGGYRLEWQLLNTSWFLPQNRERLYLIGHLAKSGRSFKQVFPIQKNDKIFNNRKRRTKSTTPVASTITNKEGSRKENNYIIKVEPVITPNRKEKRQNGRRFKNNTLDTQCNQGVITTKNYIQWDASGKGNKSQQDRAYFESGNMCTIPKNRTADKVNIITNNTQIRRLTEIECERLQGFPDNWTKYGVYDSEVKEIASTNRLKLIGNAVTTTVVKHIGEILKQNYEL